MASSDQALSLVQRTGMRLSMQQLRFVRLLEYNTPELEEAVERELEENPALDVADNDDSNDSQPGLRPYLRSASANDPAYDFSPADTSETLLEVLLRQLSEKSLPDKINAAARYIIGNIDRNGYLTRSLPHIINDMAFGPGIEVSENEAKEALEVVRNMEPYGVGGQDLRECLLIQLNHLPESEVQRNAVRILEKNYEAFTKKHTHKIISSLKISPKEADQALKLILSLNPKPGASFNSDSDNSHIIVPDIHVGIDDDDIHITLNNSIPDLVIDRTFADAMAEIEKDAKKKKGKGSEFIVNRYNDARDFIKILRQRQETMLKVMTAIVKIQKEYFLTQDVYYLKPMIIKDISQLTGLDISVISRATNNKYVSTPWGVFPLRFFFSDSIGEEGENPSEALTNRKIEAEISDIVDKEDKLHPLSDEKIRQEMEKRGYDVSRRTIAKYRDRKQIPVARLRKKM